MLRNIVVFISSFSINGCSKLIDETRRHSSLFSPVRKYSLIYFLFYLSRLSKMRICIFQYTIEWIIFAASSLHKSDIFEGVLKRRKEKNNSRLHPAQEKRKKTKTERKKERTQRISQLKRYPSYMLALICACL